MSLRGSHFHLEATRSLQASRVPQSLGPGSVGGTGELWGHAQAHVPTAALSQLSTLCRVSGGRGASDHFCILLLVAFMLGLFNKPFLTCAAYLTSAPSTATHDYCHCPSPHLSYFLPHLPVLSVSGSPRTSVGTINTSVGVLQSNPPKKPPSARRRNKLPTT